jgi:hexulose-6-phosphate isomerase
MKIGVNRWTFPTDWSLERCFEVAEQVGFDSIEINVAEKGYLTPESTRSEVEDIVAMAQAHNLELSSLSTALGWQYPITSGDASVREKGKANISRQLELAEWLGVDTILVVPGIVNAEIAYDSAYERAQQVLREVATEAESRRVAIGVENVWNRFLLSPLEFARFLDEIDSPFIGAYFDVGNVLVYGFPDQWIRILGNRIRKVHVKDFKTNINNMSGFCNVPQGHVPWVAVRSALEEIGYTTYITAEVDGYPSFPELGLKHIAESLRQIFG